MEAHPDVATALERLPLEPLLDALGGIDAYVVGGWVREVVAGREPGGDLDVGVDGDLEEVLGRLDREPGVVVHERHARFGAARAELDGLHVDLTRTRREGYPHPGALPEVEPAPIREDLDRRDFTINAIAVRLGAPHELLDPYEGQADIRASLLRVLHARSFIDDPTRAIRAARYTSRLALEPEPTTLALLRRADLGSVSADRTDAELARLAGESAAPLGFRLLAEWGVLELDEATLDLIDEIDVTASEPPWDSMDRSGATRSRAILLAAASGDRLEAARNLARTSPERPSEGVRLAAGRQPAELLVAAAAGCEWLTDYLSSWSRIGLEIDGEDLIAAGVPEGPAIGAALRGALERKLDGDLSGGRKAELELAIELARMSS